ncbi:hypothetical protein BU25DRAFT_451103 [Macroventuria anomochaeta]|uniref:Uncharacterized protein n=1 Tax=Macroventuria anomochaeta TaxID=301207 RepID=A0ACB6RRY8_9PLEO|nr:uncharacterized protein BU25DRAFT_451103 [Macroventuria anomochaeta]KAF2623909.1 hypothetical protein BU25DRAFT_451103 [Macroventuria anomochaeta]
MFTHTPPTISLHSMATRLSQIRLSPYSSRSTKKERFDYTSSPAKRSKYPARQVHRDRMAQPATQSQQAGTRRPHYQSHQQQDADRTRPGGARPLPETPRKPHHQDWNKRDEANLMKSLPRKPVQRKPLQDINPNVYDSRSTPRGPRQQQMPARKASTATSQAQSRMSEMYTMIDNHLAWNMSTSDLESDRPDSSGTMFVDFGTNGEMEVSYRNGVNKKLPTPPVPSKILAPSKPTSPRHESEVKEVLDVQQKEIKQHKPPPPRPSYSSRHDSVFSSGAEHEEHIDRFQARSLPQVPATSSRRTGNLQREIRRSYPPQVHRTQRSSSPQTALTHHTSPTPSQTSTASYHTAPPPRDDTAYTVVEPSGLTVQCHPSHTPGTGSKPATGSYVSGYDPATNYTYDYDGRTVHVHGESTVSRPSSYTSEYFDIPVSTYNASISTYHLSTSASASTAVARVQTERPLPRLPPCAQLPEPPQQDVKKRRKVLKFVQKLLHKLDDLGVMKDLSSHNRQRHSQPASATKPWVECRHVT